MTRLTKLFAELKSERVDRRFFEEEVREVKKMENGNPYLLQCAFGGNMYAFLTWMWYSSSAFTDLPRSVVEATKHYLAHDGDVELRLFWAQFQTLEPNPSLSYQMKQLMEMRRMVEPIMKDLYIQLWPTEPLSSSYFSLVQKLVDVVPQIEVLKHSIFIEGARMAFARTMVHFSRMKPLTMATAPPPARKEHKCAELYFPSAVEGARVIETHCSKDVLFELLYCHVPPNNLCLWC
ncbi:hypothetical protein ZWY2020_032600 [Hordeum vulgare]|nr:hypothetical protein ZWY2020_032600 [Hordeum vulgare]